MREFKNYIWVIILISGILLLISVFTPISYYIQPSYEGYNWMWGLSYYNIEGYGTIFNFSFIDDPIYLTLPWSLINIIISVIIFITSLILIIMGNKIRTEKTNIKDKEKKLVTIGVLMILLPVIYVINSYIFGNLYYDYHDFSYEYELWGGSNIGFAFIAPFIGGALALISGIYSKTKISREDVVFTQEKGEVITKSPSQPMTPQMLNSTKYIWIIALTGGIISLISFFTPAFYVDLYPVEEYFWMWGLHYGSISGYGSDIAFLPTQQPSSYLLPIFFSGLIPAILILISSVMLSTTANKIRTDRFDLKSAGNRLIGWGIALILASIIFLVGIGITMNAFFEYLLSDPWDPYITIPGIWDVYEPGFAVIGPFIGAILAIISGAASKTIKPREEAFITEDFKKAITKIPTEGNVAQIKYCPECGQKILFEARKFCTYCGFEFNF